MNMIGIIKRQFASEQRNSLVTRHLKNPIIDQDSRRRRAAVRCGAGVEEELKPAVELKGTLDSNADQIALQTEAQGTMVANVKSKGPDAFDFLVEGAPKDAKPLQFARQK
jgi:hypothetical protein